MYLSIVKHKTLRRGNKPRYSLLFSIQPGGFPYARGGRYSTVDQCKMAAAELAGYELPWSPENPPEDLTRCHVELLFTPTLRETPVRLCVGLGVEYPHHHGSLQQCPDCAEEWPDTEPSGPQNPSKPTPPPSPTAPDPAAQGRADYAAGTCPGPRKEPEPICICTPIYRNVFCPKHFPLQEPPDAR